MVVMTTLRTKESKTPDIRVNEVKMTKGDRFTGAIRKL
uniref:Uncharacterized protein n=1 Tax=Arundo donax TaxID=35708 RepID=A0A0A8YTK4_ARUDO